MEDCKRIAELISAYQDGEVTPEERDLVEAHLNDCASCSAVLADYQRLHKGLRRHLAGAPVPAFKNPASFLSEGKMSGVFGANASILGRLRSPGPAVGVAVVALLLVLGGLFFWLTQPAAAPPEVVEQGPKGQEVGRMSPITVAFAGAPDRTRIERSLDISPPVEGDIVWKARGEEKLFVFQPRWPGYARGVTYSVRFAPEPAGLPEPIAFNFTTEGKLKVASAIPAADAAEVATDAQVAVEFNRPVAPLTVLQQPVRGEVLRFNPPVAGEGKWLTTTTYIFRPAQGLAPSTRYNVTIPKTVSEAVGGSLEADHSFGFSTVFPAVSERSPADASLFADPGTQVKIVFNQATDRASTEARFSLVGPDGAAVPGTFGWPDDRTLVFMPDRILSLSSKYEVRLAKGAAALGKPDAATTDDARWSFTTVGLPGIESTNPRQGDPAAAQFGVEIVFTNPMDTQSVEKAISISPKPDEADLRFFWMSTVQKGPLETGRPPEDRRLRVNFPTKPSSNYTLAIGAGASDRQGQPLPPFTLSYTTAPARPSLSIARSGSAGVFDAAGEIKARISGINVSRIDLEVFGLDLATFMRNEVKPALVLSGAPSLRRWSLNIPDPPLNETIVRDVALLGADGNPLSPGFYLLQATSPEVSSPRPEQLPLVVTKTHLMLKRSDTQVLVWAVDMFSGQPLADLPVTMYQNEGAKRSSSRTDGDGVAIFDSIRPADGFSEQLYVAAERPGDASVVSSRWTQGFSPFNFQLPANFSRKVYSGYVYTDRPIYRPAQSVFYKGMVRADNDARYALPPADASFVVAITDARGKLVERRTVKLNDMGAFDGKLELSAEAAIGFYNMQVWEAGSAPEYGPDGRMAPSKGRFTPPVTTVSFQVAEYRKPEFEVSVATDQPEYIHGQTVTAKLEARYFFGQPVANADVRWQVTARPYFFTSPEAPYYSFNDLDQIYGQDRLTDFRVRKQEVGKTDAQGRLSLSFTADVSADPLSQVFVIDATVTDANRQQVASQVEVIVHKGAFYIGMRPTSYVARASEPAAVNVLTIDPKGKAVGDTAVTVSIFQRRWLSVRERQQGGFLLWRSVPQDTLVETRDLTTGADGKGSLTFTPARGGTYRLVAEGQDAAGNTVRSAVYLWVSSSEFIDWRVSNDNRIELRPDKDQYAPGDTARILVTASFTDSLGLVTEERGTISSRKVMAFPSNSTIIDVPITSEHIPNMYVSVALFKGATADNPAPSFRLGYAELKVANDEKAINIAIKADKEKTEPRQKETYDITTTDSRGQPVAAELSLALVDKAVLTLADDRAPKPLQAFWARRGLGVQTAAAYALSIDRLLQTTPVPSPGEGGKGGGGGGGAPEDVRRLFPDTAYWNPSLRTDAQGRASVTVDLPDTLTTWRLTAKAVDQLTRVGEATNEIVTSKPLIVRPVVPRFLVIGDSVRLETAVHNFSDKPQQAQVTLTAQGLTIVDSTPRSLSIPPGELRRAAWEAKVPVGDRAVVTFEARSESISDAVELALPVYSYSTPEVVATAGQVTDEPVTERVQVPGWVRKDQGDLTLEVSPSLAAAMNYSLQHVDQYPYEDVAGTVSRLLPRIAVFKAINQLGLPDTLGIKDKLPGLVTSSLQKLYNGQAIDGGWSWTASQPELAGPRFPSDLTSNPEITAYAVIGLAEAKRNGFAVDETVSRRGAEFLRTWLGLGRDVARPLDPNTKAFVLYALAAVGQGDLGLTNALVQERPKLGNDGKALLALAIFALTSNKDDVQIKALMSDLTTSAVTSSTGTHWEDPPGDRRTMNSSTRSTAMVLLALSRVSPTNPLVESTVRWLMVARREGHWATTQETAWSLLALTEYLAVSGELKADYTYQVRVNDQVGLEKKVDASNLTQPERLVTQITDLLFDQDNVVGIARSPANAPGRLYYTETLRYFPPGDNVEAVNNGIGIGREYLPATGGDALTGASAGDLVQVRLTVVAPNDLNYVVVEDYLPAGFEPIDTTLKTTSQADRQLLAQLRQALQPQKTGRWFYFNPFERAEMRDNRVALFATFLPKGVHQYIYLARATTAGEFRVMPARASETFFPEVWGRNDGTVFTVRP